MWYDCHIKNCNKCPTHNAVNTLNLSHYNAEVTIISWLFPNQGNQFLTSSALLQDEHVDVKMKYCYIWDSSHCDFQPIIILWCHYEGKKKIDWFALRRKIRHSLHGGITVALFNITWRYLWKNTIWMLGRKKNYPINHKA